jgi:amidohydrolase family protein
MTVRSSSKSWRRRSSRGSSDRVRTTSRREFLKAGMSTATALALGAAGVGRSPFADDRRETPDLILHNGKIVTMDRARPSAQAVAIKDGRFASVGESADVLRMQGPQTRLVDLKGKTAIPGLNDSHLHVIRGGLNYNMELRSHAARPVGPRRRRILRAPVRREATAHDRRAERSCTRHAGVHPAPL